MKRLIILCLLISVLCPLTKADYINKPLPGSLINPAHPLGNPVGCWFADGSNMAFDYTRNGKNGTFGDGADASTFPTLVPGNKGYAWYFDGINDYIDITDISEIELNNASFAFWVKFNDLTGDHDIITKGTHSPNQPVLVFFDFGVSGIADLGGDNICAISVIIYDGSIQHWVATPTNSISDFNWHFLAITIDVISNKLSIYIDGILKASNTKSWAGIQDTSTALRIGETTPLGTEDFSGSIDDVKIYNRALNEKEIKDLYEKPFCMFEDED